MERISRSATQEEPESTIAKFTWENKTWIIAANGVFSEEEIVLYGVGTGQVLRRKILPQPVQVIKLHRDIFSQEVTATLAWGQQETQVGLADILFARNLPVLARKGIQVSSRKSGEIVGIFRSEPDPGTT